MSDMYVTERSVSEVVEKVLLKRGFSKDTPMVPRKTHTSHMFSTSKMMTCDERTPQSRSTHPVSSIDLTPSTVSKPKFKLLYTPQGLNEKDTPLTTCSGHPVSAGRLSVRVSELDDSMLTGSANALQVYRKGLLKQYKSQTLKLIKAEKEIKNLRSIIDR